MQGKSARIFLLPESMDNMDFDEISSVSIESAHEKIDVMKVVELPAFRNKRVSQEVFQRDRVKI